MNFSDKIISLRKKNGWSQEELAERLGVTRQSVSKWESAQSQPDLSKIIQMSELFSVTTDYLLKDGVQDSAAINEEKPSSRTVDAAHAKEYLALRKSAAPKTALATAMCIISPITLLILAGLSETDYVKISENAAAGIGLSILLVIVASAVSIFLKCSSKSKDYKFLEEEKFNLLPEAAKEVQKCKDEFSDKYSRFNIVGVVLCIVSFLPLFLALCFDKSDIFYISAFCILLLAVSVGCAVFVYVGTYNSAIERLLKQGDYSPEKKSRKHIKSTLSAVYWLIVTTVVMIYTYSPYGNGQIKYSWTIWAVAGVLYGAFALIIDAVEKSKENR